MLIKKNEPKLSFSHQSPVFSGHIYMFYTFDVGDDVDMDLLRKEHVLQARPAQISKFFKQYHAPLEIELPHPHASSHCISAKIYNFGAISLTYKVPVSQTLLDLRETINEIDDKYQQVSVTDAHHVFKKIQTYLRKPSFFYHKNYYTVIQINMHPDINGLELKERFGGNIASILRFETEMLSEYQKEEILGDAIGYYKKDLIVIDTEAAFVYDPDYEEILDFFELGTLQQLELQYFDKLLDKQLQLMYERKTQNIPLSSFLPFIGSYYLDPLGDLNQLKVDISVITQRLENSIRLVGEKYFSEIYQEIVEKFDIPLWQNAIEKKLEIIGEVRQLYQNKIDANRQDFLSILIIILIMLEVGLAMWK
ncbi:hypothetical protein EBQ93_04195 [bacterium]|nr:hypothetical protein [bacterium]